MLNWKEYSFSKFVTINPSVNLEANKEYSFVEMKDLEDGKKYCSPKIKKTKGGGAKFQNYDTLFARITPCLENGKICQVRNLENNLGFGSTEFYVFRGKENISDTDFVYYLSRWEDVRAHAEINLDGTSGRQRVPKACFDDLKLNLPLITEQKIIANILSSLDNKIDLLTDQNKTLEAIAETLFRQWFVENSNDNWEEGVVSDLAIHYKKSIHPNKNSDVSYWHYSIPSFDNGKNPIKELGSEIQSNKYEIPENSILFSKLNPHKDKRIWLLQDEVKENSICSTELQVVKPKDEKYLYFLYGWLSYRGNYNEIASGVGGTSGSHQRIDPSTIFTFPCPKVDEECIIEYNNSIKPIFNKQLLNQQQIKTLAQLRDNLLPQLMSGEVRVKVEDSL
ncbi:Type I restriction modification DNA specificity domain protein [Chryseobacterium oranimense G311]|uniref:restriction endonuclease subunit S n=1 Tax=Chryseobacterium oranimense TaxID=421058 RepID=UPI000533A1A4|nr:restriction endonuclease subunit S [Chryseobacterium oranimense]CEJ72078.1 Type I restriction modification DNA specificity domain protein [Chryseobacterium oranimense G311]